MANNKRFLLISQEISPYLSGELATIGKTIATGMQSNGYDVRTFMPKFGAVNERRNQLHEVIRLSGMNIMINDNDHPLIIKVASLQPSRIQVYFIDNDDYFLKSNDDADAAGSNRSDNDERLIFFTRGTLETTKKLRWEPTVIQCAGWFTSLIPMYLKRFYGDELSFKGSKIVYMVTPDRVPDLSDDSLINKLKSDGIPAKDIKKYSAMSADPDFLHKLAIDFSHAVVFQDPDVNPALIEYAKESGKPYITAESLGSGADAYAGFFNSLK